MTQRTVLDEPAGRPWLLDGGNGRELLKRRVPILTHSWAPTALAIAADVVREVHADFIAAGADVITTNTYGLTRQSAALDGLEDRYAELHRTATRVAAEARDHAGRPVAIAGGLCPSSLRSYRPDLVEPYDVILPRYREKVEWLAPGVDLFLCETMTTGEEARAAATAAAESGKPVWVSWTLDDDRSGRLRSGETLAEAAAMLADLPVSGHLVNCCLPESVANALPGLAAIQAGTPGSRFGAYANTLVPANAVRPTYGERRLDPSDWDRYEAAAWRARDDVTVDDYLGHARSWLASGAGIVGGCCGCGPAHIAALRRCIDA